MHIIEMLSNVAGVRGYYWYTPDLLSLDSCRSTDRSVGIQGGTSPLHYAKWQAALQAHPDKAFAEYICMGLKCGFRIGFARSSPLKDASSYMFSAVQHPEPISEYLQKELEFGSMLGPFADRSGFKSIHISRFGVIPKGHNTGKWRLITDLSYPPGYSVNDGIDPNICSLRYTTVEDVASAYAILGPNTIIAKVDIESAYCLVPVHPEDRPLLGVKWKEKFYIDPMLPFGLRSAPKIFHSLADALEWRLRKDGVRNVFHYLDDFVVLGTPGTVECRSALDKLRSRCTDLGIPLAAHKCEGPSTSITFLGIVIDTATGELRLPPEKLVHIRSLLSEWGDRKACNRRELESLIGYLNHACKVVRTGRSFLRRMIDLLHRNNNTYHLFCLNRQFRSDLQWWMSFAAGWNGTSYIASNASTHFASDASGSWGCGAWHGTSWFQWRWGPLSEQLSIAVKELIPILIAALIWGRSWSGQKVLCHCDNQVVVAAIRSRSSAQNQIMHLLRCLFFIEASANFSLAAKYITSTDNAIADALSRDSLNSFFQMVPGASTVPSQIHPQTVEVLLDPAAEWTSPAWMQRFRAIFIMA